MSIIAIGTDIASVSRISQALIRNPAFADRICTPGEKAYCTKAGNIRPTHIAGHFAAKEAASKALGKGIGVIGWHDIEITHDAEGAPQLLLHGAAAKRADALNCRRTFISISHEKDHAIAMVVLEE